MTRRSLLIISLTVSLATFGFAQSTVTKTFTISGTTNSCVWHAPSGISKPPVVFFIHGANGSGGAFESETKGDVVADREKFIAVYPSASSNGGAGIWNDMSGTTNYPFFLAVIDTLDKRYTIDRKRVYMTGFSQGGFISFVAGCKYSDVFAAIAPVSGHAGSPCALKHLVPVFLTFGGQEDQASFISDINIWLKLDSCPSTPTVTHPATGITKVSYGPCAQGTYVIMDSVSGQGHQWPNKQNQAEEVWAFFKPYSLGGTTAAYAHISDAARQPMSALYASGIVRLQGAGEKVQVRVIDPKGREVAAVSAVQGQFAFKDKPSGVYMVIVNGHNRIFSLRIVVP